MMTNKNYNIAEILHAILLLGTSSKAVGQFLAAKAFSQWTRGDPLAISKEAEYEGMLHMLAHLA